MGCNAPLETALIYYPEREIRMTPAEAGLAYEDLTLQTEDGVAINAWYIPYTGAETTLLWFHGNAGNMGDRVEQIRTYHDRWQVNQMVMDYRGYGRSKGKISEEGSYEDARTALKELTEKRGVPLDHIIIFGRSLGAAVAVQLAVEMNAAGLMLEAPFASIREMARRHYPLIGNLYPLKIRYASIDKIASIAMPLLILHGDRDEVVPYGQGQMLFEKAEEPKSFFTVRGGGHNDILMYADESYHEKVREFFRQSIGSGAHP